MQDYPFATIGLIQ